MINLKKCSVYLQGTCDRLRDDNKEQAVKIDELLKNVKQKNQDHSGCKGQINNLREQVNTLTGHQESLRLLLEERESSLHETEAKLVSIEQTSNTNPTSSGDVNIEELINKRFDKIDRNIDELIEKKLAGCTASAASTATFASVTAATTSTATDGKDLASALKRSRNAELIETQERQKRENNIIIYGIGETLASENVPLNVQDKEFISSLLETIEADVTPKLIIRLGQANDQTNRPVKVVLNTTADKRKIMTNLNKLKNAEQTYRFLSVRDDYTIEERELIKSFTEEAKRKNLEGNTNVWKVRGTPKNGLHVVKITTRK